MVRWSGWRGGRNDLARDVLLSLNRQMRPRLLVLAASLALMGAAPAPPSDFVRYDLAPVMSGGDITALTVTVQFTGDASGRTTLRWVDEWAGETRLGQWARDIEVTGARRVDVGSNGARTIHARPGAPITVRYRIVSAFPGDPTVVDTKQPLPVVRPGWFYAVGEALFARPQGRGDDARPARFTWTGPRPIGFASDLEHHGGRAMLKDITESIVIGGRDLHVVASGPAGKQVRVARIGSYGFDGAAFDTLAAKVIQAERGFWGTRDEPFLVAMTPVAARPGTISYSGTGRDDAFALWMDSAAPIDRLAWLLGHEYFHTWNPRRLGDPQPAPMTAGYWFSEGLTDFYASRLMLRAQLITPDQFADFWNEKLANYALSRFRTAPNAEVAAKFWSDEQADAMQYQRGAMLAAMWDRQLRAKSVSDGLDTALRAQAATLSTLPERPTAIALFTRIMAGFGVDVRPDIAAYIDRGTPLTLATDAFGTCATVVTEQRANFERGWDADATAEKGNVVTGLDPASAAYAAGLREGMTILARPAGKPGDSRVAYVLRVSDKGAERLITFLPAGHKTTTIQELVLDKTALAADSEKCRHALAG